jgi:hypothetical protein
MLPYCEPFCAGVAPEKISHRFIENLSRAMKAISLISDNLRVRLVNSSGHFFETDHWFHERDTQYNCSINQEFQRISKTKTKHGEKIRSDRCSSGDRSDRWQHQPDIGLVASAASLHLRKRPGPNSPRAPPRYTGIDQAQNSQAPPSSRRHRRSPQRSAVMETK